MERLTTTNKDVSREMICRNENCGVTEEHCPHLMEDECACLREVINKLADYEDAEEQCIAENQCGLRELLLKWKAFFDDITELYEYRKAEEQGLLLRLPCKVGDTVWSLDNYCNDCFEHSDYCHRGCKKPSYIIKEHTVRRFDVLDDKIYVCSFDRHEMYGEFGKTVFLTKKEAESALAEKGGVE